jgi:hypothetical protein
LSVPGALPFGQASRGQLGQLGSPLAWGADQRHLGRHSLPASEPLLAEYASWRLGRRWNPPSGCETLPIKGIMALCTHLSSHESKLIDDHLMNLSTSNLFSTYPTPNLRCLRAWRVQKWVVSECHKVSQIGHKLSHLTFLSLLGPSTQNTRLESWQARP